jgi:2-aminoethylphosphonate-pyruvate transaminase
MSTDFTHNILLTPGPITTTRATKEAMLIDLSPNAEEIVGMTATARRYLLEIANGTATHECVPLQGSATYACEALFHACTAPGAKVLVIVNGFYGLRLGEILEAIGRRVVKLEKPILPLPTGAEVGAALDADPEITHVAICHVETGTGVLNRIEEIAKATRARGRNIFIDTVASFGAFPLDVAALDVEAVAISPNKCMEGLPGIGFAVIRRDSLIAAEGKSPSISLDLFKQWSFMESTKGQWRFTPPTHVVAAFANAVARHKEEGGREARLEKYRRNWKRLVDAMRQNGFRTMLPDEVSAPIVTTWLDPADPAYNFKDFYEAMRRRGFTIFPGRLTAAGTFRIGCMGDIDPETMAAVARAVAESMDEIGVKHRGPAADRILATA